MALQNVEQLRRLLCLEPSEGNVLRDCGSRIAPDIPEIARKFYDRLEALPDAAPLLAGKRETLLAIFARWIASLFAGEYQDGFWAEQERLGAKHRRIGIPDAVLAAGFSILRTELMITLLNTENPEPALVAVNKLLDLCQYIFETSYLRTTEHDRIKSLRALSQEFDPETFFHAATQQAYQLIGADGAALILQEDDWLQYAFFQGLPESYRRLAAHRFPISSGTAGLALLRKQPVYEADYPHSSCAMPEFVEAGLRGSLALPLLGPDGGLGVLTVSWFASAPPEWIAEDAWDFLRLLSDLLANVLYRTQLESRLEGLATRDTLTGLPNRRAFPDRIAGAIARARRHSTLLALLFIDLDGFKPINDQLGHAIGDATLIAVAQSLRQAVRQGDTLLRYAGDEFLVLLEETGHVAEIEAVTSRLLLAIRRDVEKDGIKLPLSASIGITIYPFDEATVEELVHHADQAMYWAKQAGGNTWRLYEDHTPVSLDAEDLLAELERALERREFRLYWQPIIELQSGRISGVEALLRWQHPERGLLTPGAFLEALERSPLMPAVGDWVLQEALAQAEQWHRDGKDWDIHVNLAAVQLEEPGFAHYLERLLYKHPDLHKDALWLEIVERVALRDIPATAGMIQACRKLGVHFTLDDFGTGAAAIQYLVELECSGLKIDKSLVSPQGQNGKHHTMVRALVDMAQSLSVKIVAEGIEDAETAEKLINLGVTHAQGYHFSRPVPAEHLEQDVVDST